MSYLFRLLVEMSLRADVLRVVFLLLVSCLNTGTHNNVSNSIQSVLRVVFLQQCVFYQIL